MSSDKLTSSLASDLDQQRAFDSSTATKLLSGRNAIDGSGCTSLFARSLAFNTITSTAFAHHIVTGRTRNRTNAFEWDVGVFECIVRIHRERARNITTLFSRNAPTIVVTVHIIWTFFNALAICVRTERKVPTHIAFIRISFIIMIAGSNARLVTTYTVIVARTITAGWRTN